ncbi:hypothetical protein [Dysgonomonas sp. 520]|uniref:hypothetical protein n=1 Tax=Dysgonomonas sp. 520 TaxID=2302931 RepID=UPI0013D65FE5|nr:hypothetical protein [Dysgonomonas sp. 520]NDW11214.1 hypothetical protein [Dysgonomonas sp. 520]
MIAIAVDSIESFTEYLKEVNEFDDKPFRKIGKECTDSEIADMFLTGKIKLDDAVYLGLSMKRLKSIANMIEFDL